jgi:alpha-beta hydrolase superfamily lysophospholipase
VAEALNGRALGTLLLDLLTPAEDVEDQRTRTLRFDVPLLAGRLERAVQVVANEEATRGLPVGLFGASTGAAAALIAAARRQDQVGAVVCRGGRPDLAGEALEQVKAPTLLIVGGRDEAVVSLNEQAMTRMKCEKRLELVPEATHLFSEPGALERVADLAADWFSKKLS